MAHDDKIDSIMESLRIATKHQVGDVMASWGFWSRGTSASNNSDKVLKNEVSYGKLIKENNYYKRPDCRSTFQPHSQFLTDALVEVLKLNLNAKIYREYFLKEISLRLDALVFLTKGNRHLVFALEVCNTELPEYLVSKVNALKNYDGALQTFSLLFETKIKAFDIVVSGDISANGVFEFKNYIEEVKK